MILRSIVLLLEGNRELVEKEFLGYYAYSFFISQIKKIDKDKAKIYHQKNVQKPFTISAPFVFGDKIYMRVCFLNDEVFSLFLSSLFTTERIKLKEDFRLIKVYLNKEKSLPRKISRLVKIFSEDEEYYSGDFLTLKILTPAIFKKRNNYQTIIDVDLIRNSFEKKQLEIYQKIIFPLPKFLIDQIYLRSKAIKLEPFGDFVGMVGKIRVKLLEKKSTFPALEFFGLGIKTTMGLGQLLVDRCCEGS